VAHFFGDELSGIASITSLICSIWPCCISRRMTSTARSDMRLARSPTVIAFGDGDFAHELFLSARWTHGPEALRAAAERGDRALAYFVGAQGGDQSQAAAFLRRCGARAAGRAVTGRAGRHHRDGARRARSVVFLDFQRHTAGPAF